MQPVAAANSSSLIPKDSSVASAPTAFTPTPKRPANNTSQSALMPNPFMNQLQGAMQERVVHVHQYFNTYQVQPQGYMSTSGS